MPPDPSLLGVYFLDVGQGDCTFIVPPDGQGAPILFDCADQYVAERFVANHAITDLEAVVASHLDRDHIRGLLPFLRNHFAAGRRVRRLVLALDRHADPEGDVGVRALVEQALVWEKSPPHAGFALVAPERTGDGPLQLASGPGWQVDLVLPWLGTRQEELLARHSDTNHTSAVLRVARGAGAILMGGDAPLGSWERLEPPLRPARVIRAPHHGGEIRSHGEAWTEFGSLYDAVGAHHAVFSVGTRNGDDHPIPEHIRAAHRAGACRVLCTQLTPRCHHAPQSLRAAALHGASGVEWPYRHRAELGAPKHRPRNEVPCAGSVVAWLTEEGRVEVEPRRGGHEQLLRRVEAPICSPS